MEFVCYNDWKQLPRSAGSLFVVSAKRSIFFAQPRFENLTRNTLDDHKETLLACVIDGDTALAILPLARHSREHFVALTNLYSSLYTLLLVESNQSEILDCLARGLTQLPFASLRLDRNTKGDNC